MEELINNEEDLDKSLKNIVTTLERNDKVDIFFLDKTKHYSDYCMVSSYSFVSSSEWTYVLLTRGYIEVDLCSFIFFDRTDNFFNTSFDFSMS